MAKGKKKIKAGTIILIIVILLIVAVIAITALSAASMSKMAIAETAKLRKKDLENTVSVSGLVESRTFKSVTSALGYPVESINVEEGDKVKKGDVLCILDTNDLQDQIVQQQANMDKSSLSTDYSISDAEKAYNDALAAYNDGSNTSIRAAKSTLDNAEAALNKAKDKYAEQQEIAGSDRDSQRVSAENSVASAEKELSYAKSDYEDAKKDKENEDYSKIKDLKKNADDAKKEYDSRYSVSKNEELRRARTAYESSLEHYNYLAALIAHGSTEVNEFDLNDAKDKAAAARAKLAELEAKSDAKAVADAYDAATEAYTKAKSDIDAANDAKLDAAKRAYERAQTNLETAKKNLSLVENGSEMSLKEYKNAVDDAQKAYDNAKENYDLIVKDAEKQLSTLKAAADRQRILSENDPSQISLDILTNKLDRAVITAPCDGTVTSVKAVEGAPATGTLFIIEDTDDLKMSVSVKEYNIGELSEGLPVTVKASALGDKEFEGVIAKIAPAAVKGMDGKSDGSSAFKADVNIRDTKDSGLLIGMTAKMTAVTGSAENVFAVTYDAIVEDENGKCHILVVDKDPRGVTYAKRIDVETGFESDAEIEISSPELTEDMDIITNAGDVTEGGPVITMDMMSMAVNVENTAE